MDAWPGMQVRNWSWSWARMMLMVVQQQVTVLTAIWLIQELCRQELHLKHKNEH